jgi:tetratricopeptide (TPR) repeat protein
MTEWAQVPIVILSFDRTDYLRSTLISLINQTGPSIASRQVYLFQDGAVNEFSGTTRCDPAIVQQNVELFRSLIPTGIPCPAPRNLGVALNFDRAERLVFEDLKAEAAIFLEDDLVLGRHYLKTLETLISLALRDERIGYVAAYGNHRASYDEQLANRSKLILMGHNWAFGLTRKQWLRQQPYVDEYLNIVRESDYRGRDHDRIIELFHSWGLGVPGTSQDIAKTHATILTNTAKVSTYACFGNYIGQKGLHFNPEAFASMGYGNTQVMQEDVFELVPPTDAELRTFITTLRHSAMTNAVRPSKPAVQAVALAPAPELLNRIQAMHAIGKFAEAEVLCNRALAECPDYKDRYGHPAFLKEALRLTLALGDLDKASCLASVLSTRLRPNDPCVHVLFGRHHWLSGDAAAAQKEARSVLRLEPNNQEAARWLQAT